LKDENEAENKLKTFPKRNDERYAGNRVLTTSRIFKDYWESVQSAFRTLWNNADEKYR
jgi:hypothetical protein